MYIYACIHVYIYTAPSIKLLLLKVLKKEVTDVTATHVRKQRSHPAVGRAERGNLVFALACAAIVSDCFVPSGAATQTVAKPHHAEWGFGAKTSQAAHARRTQLAADLQAEREATARDVTPFHSIPLPLPLFCFGLLVNSRSLRYLRIPWRFPPRRCDLPCVPSVAGGVKQMSEI